MAETGIRYIRETLGYSVEEFYGQLNVSKSMASQWETGSKPISKERLNDLHQITGLPRELITKCGLSELDKIQIEKAILSNQFYDRRLSDVNRERELRWKLDELNEREQEANIVEKIRNALHDFSKNTTNLRRLNQTKLGLYDRFTNIISQKNIDIYYVKVMLNVLDGLNDFDNEKLDDLEKDIHDIIVDHDKTRQEDRAKLEELKKRVEEFKKQKNL